MPSRWAPLESNPEVLTQWAGLVGLSTKLSAFSDVYSLDEELLALVPQPVKAVLLVFPLTDEIEAHLRAEDAKIQGTPQPNLDPKVYFIKQTISNACGTIALLHSIYNSDVKLEPASALQKFQEQSIELTPQERAKLLETTELFATAHATAASGGQSRMPEGGRVNEHFVAFVQARDPTQPDNSEKRRLIELDGRRSCPADLGESTDLLKDAAKFIKSNYMSLTNSDTFSMIALGPPAPEWD